MEANEITYLIRGAAFRVHTALGPGLLESVYEAALKYELQRDELRVRNQVGIPMIPAIVKQATRITHKFQYKQAGG
ncbi:MAG: GxxExxY protein [Saprospiraceae bacterium]|jgi:GxxExxY protein|nr:GxxExxY protein [Saprospiraceae bacterium]